MLVGGFVCDGFLSGFSFGFLLVFCCCFALICGFYDDSLALVVHFGF